jgi:hypothetical protein
VCDERVDFFTGIHRPKKTVYAEIHFSDMPGETPSKSSGELLAVPEWILRRSSAFFTDLAVRLAPQIDQALVFSFRMDRFALLWE